MSNTTSPNQEGVERLGSEVVWIFTEPSAILVISTSLLRIVAFFLFKEAYFYVGWLLVTSRCASRGSIWKIEASGKSCLPKRPAQTVRCGSSVARPRQVGASCMCVHKPLTMPCSLVEQSKTRTLFVRSITPAQALKEPTRLACVAVACARRVTVVCAKRPRNAQRGR